MNIAKILKKIIYIFIIIIITVILSALSYYNFTDHNSIFFPIVFQSTEESGNWHLVWNDEFNGNTLDTSKWTARYGGWDPEWHLPENVTVSDGILTITAKYEDYDVLHFTSGMIYTKGKFEQTYGMFEARMKLPKTGSLNPAFWMEPASMPDGNPDPNWNFDPQKIDGEVDIVEYGWWLYSYQIQGGMYTGAPLQGRGRIRSGGYWYEDYHIYSFSWETKPARGEKVTLRWYVDGQKYLEVTDWFDSKGYPHPFDNPFFIILNLGAGLHVPYPPDYPAYMYVDWVRVYSH